jgi:hypothetical protein
MWRLLPSSDGSKSSVEKSTADAGDKYAYEFLLRLKEVCV